MKKKIIIGIILVAFIAVLVMFMKNNGKAPTVYSTEKPFYTTIIKQTLATGSIIPLEKIEIKPQIPGIIEKIYVEEFKEKNTNIVGILLIDLKEIFNSMLGG